MDSKNRVPKSIESLYVVAYKHIDITKLIKKHANDNEASPRVSSGANDNEPNN
jgi:hypothetical protein